jgi:hypothetical protein
MKKFGGSTIGVIILFPAEIKLIHEGDDRK